MIEGQAFFLPNRRLSRRLVWVVLLLVIGYLSIYVALTEKLAPAWDSAAYVYAGRQLARGDGLRHCNALNATVGPYFTLTGFYIPPREEAPDCLYSKYPPGLPLLLALAERLTGTWAAPFFVPALTAALALLTTFVVGTLLYDASAALIATALLGGTPAFLYFSTSPWSNVPGVAFLCAGLAAFLWARKRSSASVAGLMAGGGALLIVFSGFIRYAELVYFLPLALFVFWVDGRSAWKRRVKWQFAIASLLGIGLLMVWNKIYFGGFLNTGYDPAYSGYTAFSWRYMFGPSRFSEEGSLPATLQTMWREWGFWLLLALVGLFRAVRRKEGVTVGMAGMTLALYSVYAYPTTHPLGSRHLLPAFPFVALWVASGLYAGYDWLRSWGYIPQRVIMWGGILIISVAILLPLPSRLDAVRQRNSFYERHVLAVESLTQGTPSDAVFLAYHSNDPILLYGERTTLYYRIIPRESFSGELTRSVSQLLTEGTPVYYVADTEGPFRPAREVLEERFKLLPVDKDTLFRVVLGEGQGSP